MNMHSIRFHKYQGTGNDFVMIDNREGQFDKSDLSVIPKICDRRFGIGADGVILIENHPELDFEMVYYNPDASQSLCGNGSRCAVMFARFLGMIGSKTTFEAIDGKHEAEIKEGLVHLKMHDVQAVERLGNDFLIDTGSPHYIRFVEEVNGMPVVEEGRKIRYSERFEKEGVNVNFLTATEGNTLAIRTYERGVENETFSCGTGCTAAALAASFDAFESPVQLQARGGQLQVAFEADGDGFRNIYLIGPAEAVFEGEIDLESL